jgi:hypothetical protein
MVHTRHWRQNHAEDFLRPREASGFVASFCRPDLMVGVGYYADMTSRGRFLLGSCRKLGQCYVPYYFA